MKLHNWKNTLRFKEMLSAIIIVKNESEFLQEVQNLLLLSE